jgi:hypothetical protein
LARSFWTRGNIDDFRRAANAAIETLGLSQEELDSLLRKHVSTVDESELPSQRTIDRFRKGQTKKIKKTDHLAFLLHALATEASSHGNLTFRDKQGLEPLIAIQKRFRSDPSTSTLGGTDEFRETPKLRSNVDQKIILDALLANMNLPSIASSSAASSFIERDKNSASFLLYRFSGTPGKVVKSYLVVKKSRDAFPMTTFAIFREVEGSGRRVSRGVVLSFKDEIALLGQSESGSSAKLLTLGKTHSPRDVYSGLLLTNDPDDGALAARVLAIRTDSSDHIEAKTGTYSVAAIIEEIGEEKIRLIRNKIRFIAEGRFQNKIGIQLEQREMVRHVDKVLFGENELLLDGKTFNPADDYHYTFNSALRPRD